MIKNNAHSIWSSLIVSAIFIGLVGCQAQNTAPTLTPTLPSPTSVPPTSIPPTLPPPSPVPSHTPLPSAQVQSLQDIVGSWKSKCDTASCLFTFSADGTFKVTEIYNGVPVLDREWGNVSVSDGVFHFESTFGICTDTKAPNADYQAFITYKDGKPAWLRFEATQPDKCADRQKALERDMPSFSQ